MVPGILVPPGGKLTVAMPTADATMRNLAWSAAWLDRDSTSKVLAADAAHGVHNFASGSVLTLFSGPVSGLRQLYRFSLWFQAADIIPAVVSVDDTLDYQPISWQEPYLSDSTWFYTPGKGFWLFPAN